MPSRKPGIRVCCVMTNRAMTLFTSLGPSADCRGLTQVTTYQVRTGHARGAAFSVSQRRFSLGWGLQGKVARTPHQSKGSDGTVCSVCLPSPPRDCLDGGEHSRWHPRCVCVGG